MPETVKFIENINLNKDRCFLTTIIGVDWSDRTFQGFSQGYTHLSSVISSFKRSGKAAEYGLVVGSFMPPHSRSAAECYQLQMRRSLRFASEADLQDYTCEAVLFNPREQLWLGIQQSNFCQFIRMYYCEHFTQYEGWYLDRKGFRSSRITDDCLFATEKQAQDNIRYKGWGDSCLKVGSLYREMTS